MMIWPVAETANNFTSGPPVFKGQVTWWVDPMLGDTSEVAWYCFAKPLAQARPIVYAHQVGFEEMQRRDFYWPPNQSRVFQFATRVAVAINNWRGVQKNAGQ